MALICTRYTRKAVPKDKTLIQKSLRSFWAFLSDERVKAPVSFGDFEKDQVLIRLFHFQHFNSPTLQDGLFLRNTLNMLKVTKDI